MLMILPLVLEQILWGHLSRRNSRTPSHDLMWEREKGARRMLLAKSGRDAFYWLLAIALMVQVSYVEQRSKSSQSLWPLLDTFGWHGIVRCQQADVPFTVSRNGVPNRENDDPRLPPPLSPAVAPVKAFVRINVVQVTHSLRLSNIYTFSASLLYSMAALHMGSTLHRDVFRLLLTSS